MPRFEAGKRRAPAMRILLAAALAISIGSAHATVVRVGDREWMQLTNLAWASYVDLAAVFDPATGKVSGPSTEVVISEGNIRVDVAGWTWASYFDVLGLFEQIPGHSLYPLTNPDLDIIVGEQDSTLGEFMWANFDITYLWNDWGSLTDGYLWYGWVRDTYLSDGIVMGVQRRAVKDWGPGGDDYLLHYVDFVAAHFVTIDPRLSPGSHGAWLYRDVVDVPEPPAIALLALGFVLMARRRLCARIGT